MICELCKSDRPGLFVRGASSEFRGIAHDQCMTYVYGEAPNPQRVAICQICETETPRGAMVFSRSITGFEGVCHSQCSEELTERWRTMSIDDQEMIKKSIRAKLGLAA